MLSKRIIVCLDVKEGRVVKGVGFRQHEDMGDIVELAQRYIDQGADELVFYDITASPDGRTLDANWIRRLSPFVNIPFAVAGGIDSIEAAEKILWAGADKISVNSPALRRPDLINELSEHFGAQCVVVGIDSQLQAGRWSVWQNTGRVETSEQTSRLTEDWIKEVQDRGAGEIVLNCMDRDGRRSGFDIEQLKALKKYCRIPLIASGGAGCADDFAKVFQEAGVEGALAAGIFHRGQIKVADVKNHLIPLGLPIRSEILAVGKGVSYGSRL